MTIGDDGAGDGDGESGGMENLKYYLGEKNYQRNFQNEWSRDERKFQDFGGNYEGKGKGNGEYQGKMN